MDASCITTQQIVYYTVDVPSLVNISGSKSVLCWLFRTDASRVKISAQGRNVCEYAYRTGKLMIWELWALQLLPVGADRVSGRGGVGSGVRCQRRLGVGVPVWLHLQHVCKFFAGPFWEGTDPAVWFWRSIAGCLCIAAFTMLYPGNSWPRIFSSWALGRGCLIQYYVSSTEARKVPPFAIFTIFKARRMSDCFICTRPPFLSIITNMLKTYKKLVVAYINEIGQITQSY